MTEWITDRVPTEADGDNNGDVRMRVNPSGIGRWVYYSCVGIGAAWRHHEGWREGDATPAEPSPAAEPGPAHAPEPEPTPPQFAVGQVWKTRDGRRATIEGVGHGPEDICPLLVRILGQLVTYEMDGSWDKGSKSDFDLIELIEDVPASEPQPAPEPGPEAAEPGPDRPRFAVGQRWRVRGGSLGTIGGVGTITDVDGCRPCHPIVAEIDFSFRDKWHESFRHDGTQGFSRLRLVELIEDAPVPEPVAEPAPEPESNPPAPTPTRVPRLFAQPVRRSWDPKEESWILDAIADDGTCWLLRQDWSGWHQVESLPDREAPTDG